MADSKEVLVVESNPRGLQELSDLLSGMSLTVSTAVSAREAFAHLFHRNFDLILLSVQLPNIDGLTIASHIRNREQSRSTPLLFITAKNGTDSLVSRILSMGNTDYIPKPVSPDLFRAKVENGMHRSRGTGNEPESGGHGGVEVAPAFLSNIASRESLNQAAIEGMQDTAILWENSEGIVIDSNSQVRRLLGYQEREIIGLHASEFFGPEDREAGIPELEMRLAREEGKAIDERWHLRKDGSRIWAVGLVTPLWKSPGELEGYIKILRDRTDQKIAEELTRDTLERYKHLLDSTVEGIIGFDLDAICTFANAACLRLLGFPDEKALVGLDLHQITPPHSVSDAALCEAGDCPVISDILGGKITHGEAEFRRTDGTRIQAEYRMQPVRVERIVIGAVVTFMDVSERKRYEARLQAMQAHARQAQKLESLGRFAGGVAHELNNDLTTVIGYGELLLDRIHPQDPIRNEVAEILEGGKKAADLVRKLLTFAGMQHISTKPIELDVFLRERFDQFREAMGEKIRISLELDPNLPRVISEPAMLERTILDLLSNAREAMSEEGSLSIKASRQDLSEPSEAEKNLVSPGIYDCISITDTGRGMPGEILEKIFDPFFSTKEISRSSVGLGLSSAYGFINQCGGTIRVASEASRGAAIQVYLPVAPRPSAA